MKWRILTEYLDQTILVGFQVIQTINEFLLVSFSCFVVPQLPVSNIDKRADLKEAQHISRISESHNEYLEGFDYHADASMIIFNTSDTLIFGEQSLQKIAINLNLDKGWYFLQ